MESEEDLVAPIPAFSHKLSPSRSFSAAPPQNLTTQCSLPSAGNIPSAVCGESIQKTNLQCSITNSSSSFGLLSSSSGRFGFGGIGSLDLPSLGAHLQFGTFKNWWQPTAAHTNEAATAFFSPFLGLHPVFVSNFDKLCPVALQPHPSGKRKRTETSPPPVNSAVNVTSSAEKQNKDKSKANGLLLSLHRPVHRKTIHEPKEQLLKRPQTRVSRCQSGPLTDSSTDAEDSSISSGSSDPDDVEEEDHQSSDSEDSVSKQETAAKRNVELLTHGTNKKRWKRPGSVDGNAAWESHHPHHDSVADRPQSTAHSAEGPDQQHVSVIQATGSLAETHKERSPLPHNSPPNSASVRSKHYAGFQSISSPKTLSPSSLTKQITLLTSKEAGGKPENVDRMKQSCERSSLKNIRKQWPSTKGTSSVPPKSQFCDSDLFLNPRGWMQDAVQDAPLALIKKAPCQSHAPSSPRHLPVMNLDSQHRDVLDASSLKPSVSTLPPQSQKNNAALSGEKMFTKTNSSSSPLNLSRNTKSYLLCRRDSLGDNDDEDSGSSLSENNPDTVSEGSEEEVKESLETGMENRAVGTLLKPSDASFSSHGDISNTSAHYLSLNKMFTEPLVLQSGGLFRSTTTTGVLEEQSAFATIQGSGITKRVTDERTLQLPLEFGWRRETRIRAMAGHLQREVAYIAPCGRRLRQYSDIMKYLIRYGITEISRHHFSLSAKVKVGDFYEARDGPQGLQWVLLADGEIAPVIAAMNGRRRHGAKSKHQLQGDGSGAKNPHLENVVDSKVQSGGDAKLFRRIEAQEIARRAAQIKMWRKFEKQAMRQAAKEAKRRQAIMAAEERQKKREELKILKQQEKIRRIQQIRTEKELRAQRILEEKRMKKEAAANARILKAEKHKKEKQMHKLQAIMQKQQERERHKLDLERERRRQHMVIMKALEAQRRSEEKERLKKEKLNEKRLKRERKLEHRRIEVEKAKELRKPKEDMCLTDHKPLPELSRIPGLVLPGRAVSDCLMVLHFLCNFGEVLGLGLDSGLLAIGSLQEGLLNIGNNMLLVQDLLVSLLSAAVCDPGVPAGHKCKTILGEHLSDVEIDKDNASEILQIFMESHSDQTHVAVLADSLKTRAFQAHTPPQKAFMLAFLVNELCCSKAVICEIHKKMDFIANLRKEKWTVEEKLRKLRNSDAKTTGIKSSSAGEQSHAAPNRSVKTKGNKIEDDSEEEEDEGDDSEDQGDNEEMVSELQREIRQKLFDSSHSLHSTMIGQDRYKRRYWILPQCGGIFVEGIGNDYEEADKKGGIQTDAQPETIGVKDEPFILDLTSDIYRQKSEFRNKDVFLQKPEKFPSKLEAKSDQDQDASGQSSHSPEAPSNPTSQMDEPPLLSPPQLQNFNWMNHSPPSILPNDQPSKVSTDTSGGWFSLLPRSPCDASSMTSDSYSSASSSPEAIRTTVFPFASPSAADTRSAINNVKSPGPQQVKSDIHHGGMTLSDEFSLTASPSLSCSGTSLPSPPVEVDGDQTINPELHRNQPEEQATGGRDHPCPQPITGEMLHGWWKVSDLEGLLKSLHSRGIRERNLQKQILKHKEHLSRLCLNTTGLESVAPGKSDSYRRIIENWSVEQKAKEVDVSLLQQVQALERRVLSADLQDGTSPVADRMCQGYRENKTSSLEIRRRKETSQEDAPDSVTGQADNPLETAVARLEELERNINHAAAAAAGSESRLWHKALRQVRASAQLSLCIQHLQKSVVWEQAVQRAEKSRASQRRDLQSQTAGGGLKQSCQLAAPAWLNMEAASSRSGQNRTGTDFNPASCTKKAQISKDDNSQLAVCRVLLAELEAHKDAWPFLTPVNHKVILGYRKVIKKPMDFSTIKKKLNNNLYFDLETFMADVNLVFDNCEKFNEDDSEIGRAGHNMRRFFEELLQLKK
ncbi:bromodomain adjacent to zinc finger domain protein 2B isoform X3 [Oryzias latipes]|uniref:bromodomain adjacent to zinc finger domain protein 2B isoform X3 n=1 Tax=Oryzias latipes TaxID=8090 RepID=UPI0009DA0260|nr:bromodomain adjacent to zinc finger domain protein 2B isoform X3 [Oryzias latipes]